MYIEKLSIPELKPQHFEVWHRNLLMQTNKHRRRRRSYLYVYVQYTRHHCYLDKSIDIIFAQGAP